MTLTYPLSVADFMDILPVGSMTMEIPEMVETARTKSGALISVNVGDRLWQGDIKLGNVRNSRAGHAQVLIDLLRGDGRTCLIYDKRRPGPLYDLDGMILGASVPTIASLSSDGREMSIAGLPPNYMLAIGDYLGFMYGSPATSYALHRVVDLTVMADDTGLTPLFEVMPEIQPGAAIGATLTLIKAPCKAQIVPGSTQAGSGNAMIFGGQRFSFLQTLG